MITHADVTILPAHTGTVTREHKVKSEIHPAALTVALLTLPSAVFANALIADFQFDDFQDIVDNRMAAFDGLLAAAHHTVRPLMKFSYALNDALAGVQPLTFHAVNIGPHLGSILLAFFLVRRAADLLCKEGTEALRLALGAITVQRNAIDRADATAAGQLATVDRSLLEHTGFARKESGNAVRAFYATLPHDIIGKPEYAAFLKIQICGEPPPMFSTKRTGPRVSAAASWRFDEPGTGWTALCC
jgi:hypothetical protein